MRNTMNHRLTALSVCTYYLMMMIHCSYQSSGSAKQLQRSCNGLQYWQHMHLGFIIVEIACNCSFDHMSFNVLIVLGMILL